MADGGPPDEAGPHSGMAYALLVRSAARPAWPARKSARADGSLEALRPRLSTGLPFVASPCKEVRSCPVVTREKRWSRGREGVCGSRHPLAGPLQEIGRAHV